MTKKDNKFKLGTADTLLLAVGTLAVDYICTSKSEILEVQPGGKKVYTNHEELEKKIKQYGIKKGRHTPGSSLGNFISQAQELVQLNPAYAPVHLATTLAPKDPSTKLLLDALDKKGVQYDITHFTAEDAANPIGLLVESGAYTKILSFKDKRMPAIEVKTPKNGTPGLVIIGSAAGDGVQSKQNALNYAKKHTLPVAMLTTENDLRQLAVNPELKKVFKEMINYATFFAANEDEVRRIIQIEQPELRPSRDRVELAQQLREVFNKNLDILLTYGNEGSLVLVDDYAVIQKVPWIPVEEIISTAGAGDALAGVFIEAVRIKGMDLEGVKWALPRANRVAQSVLKYADTRTGQFTAEQIMEEPPAEYETEVIKIKK